MSAHVPALPFEIDPLIAEAKQRARRRRLIAVVALATAGAAVWGLLASSGGGSSGEIPWLPTRPQLGPANPTLAAACTASQLGAKLELQGGGFGTLVGGISIRNRSTEACALVGRPRLSFAGATSKWHQTRHRQDGPVDPLAPPLGSLRALAPGKWVWVGINWAGWCGRGSNNRGDAGTPPSAMLLLAPGGGTIALARDQLGGRRLPLRSPQCFAGPGTASNLAATRFTPYIPQGGPSSALPLHVRIVPGTAARPGRWFTYTVVLTNHSRSSFAFGRTCPAYQESIGDERPPTTYILNCHAAGTIAPHASVRFAMRIRVPRTMHPGDTPSLWWTLAPHSWNAPQALSGTEVG